MLASGSWEIQKEIIWFSTKCIYYTMKKNSYCKSEQNIYKGLLVFTSLGEGEEFLTQRVTKDGGTHAWQNLLPNLTLEISILYTAGIKA